MTNYVDTTFQSPTCISIGPGIRGLERGVEQVIGPLRELCLVEIEAFILENLVQQMEQGFLAPALVWPNVKTFPAAKFRGCVDWIFAGYPCQPFSVAGNRKGTTDPRHIYPYIESAIDAIRPIGCFFENVTGHLSLGYREVRQSLESLHYTVTEGIFSAEEVGAAHRRERLFILALDNSYLQRLRSQHQIPTGRNSAELTGEESQLANSKGTELKRTDNSWSRRNGFANESSELADNNRQWQQQCEGNNQEGRGWTRYSRQLADPAGIGVQGHRAQGQQIPEIPTGETISGCHSRRTVARPGQQQYDWEEPRTLTREAESAVGVSVNGYNFREDLLRALGNSVYAPTAALAFRTLMMKILR